MKLSDITVYAIRVKKMEIFINYTYVVSGNNSKTCVLIDPTWEDKKIEYVINSNKLKVVGVLLTHSHFDHTILANYFADKYSCNIWMSHRETTYYDFKSPLLSTFKENEVISLEGIKIDTHLTPGHTKGSTCYIIGNNIFTGDTLFIEGCGECEGKGGDPVEMYNSINYLKNLIRSDMLVYPGHSFGDEPGQSFSYLYRKNIYLNFSSKEHFVNFRTRKNQKNILAFK